MSCPCLTEMDSLLFLARHNLHGPPQVRGDSQFSRQNIGCPCRQDGQGDTGQSSLPCRSVNGPIPAVDDEKIVTLEIGPPLRVGRSWGWRDRAVDAQAKEPFCQFSNPPGRGWETPRFRIVEQQSSSHGLTRTERGMEIYSGRASLWPRKSISRT